MKRIILLFLISLITIEVFSQELSLSSPDQKITVNISLSSQLNYDVMVDSNMMISNGTIDMQLSKEIFLSYILSVKSTKTKNVNETIIAQIPVSRKNIPDHYNELTITFKNNFAVIFRAYNDGVAYRIATNFKDSITVVNETAAFNFVNGAHAYAPVVTKRPDEDVFHTSFEELYTHKSIDSFSANDYMFTPVLTETADNIKVAITESDLDDYPGMFLQGTAGNGFSGTFAPYPLEEKVVEGDYPQKVVTKRADYIAKTKGTRNFPWRVMLIAREDKELPTNDLVYRLASPTKIENASWIHPGKCTDEWIIDINLFNVPFKSGINTATYKYYIDFAKRFGLDRIMMDAGWSNTKDLFDINPHLNMDTLAAFAQQQGIKLSMWTLAMTLDKQLDSALKQFQQWGVDFIMTDFIDRDDQKTVNFYKRITEACAKAHIMIMFHGAYPPKGFNRTYPNNITREAVLGSEYNAWSDKPTSSHNCIIPFTRMLAGPLDYEPGLLDNATPQQFKPIWGKVMSQTTRCQQLAMFVVYDNPLQIFSGNPSQGLMEPAFMQLLGSVPTTWDTTIITDARVGAYIITARKHGNSWFIAGITDTTARDLTVPLSFLSAGNYTATICKDGINANRNAMDYAIEEKTLTANDALQIHLAPGGGFLVGLKKE
ncbi:glycoside hydrolase family 97 protein [Panacibacter ginsenosidivorans]|uniref:Glycoside hydrolase family 97 protein n=1 Tax=Panacibacter ginsenosidivorans TaxID=1813871 RepID=A0A5B8V5V3_9BACT|nr:glycoside hydrolase family 97 protein [Panacibacter ginsenosidivorans]QEC66589.1 glycoside hydrolase family 97 protein [Panacibacter ginsenosidivorans]